MKGGVYAKMVMKGLYEKVGAFSAFLFVPVIK